MTPPDYFDVLPYHPQPRPLESLSGYLTRLTQGNGWPTLQRLWDTCFPGRKRRFSLDYPLNNWGALPVVTLCPEARLQATTFHHLALKFGCSSPSSALSRFLNEGLSPGLRYCPACIAENGYYSLAWRFLILTGCPSHHAQLLDHCPGCLQTIPLLTPPFKIECCPHCGYALDRASLKPLTALESQTAINRYQDLLFLLEPLSGDSHLTQSVGLKMAHWRLAQGLSVADISQQTGLPYWVVYDLERGRANGIAKLGNYVRYVDFLGITLRQLFQTSLPPEVTTSKTRVFHYARLIREQELVEQVKAAINRLERKGQVVSQRAIAQLVGREAAGLRWYPAVKSILDQVVAANRLAAQQRRQLNQRQAKHPDRQNLDREAELVAAVEAAIATLEARDQPVSQRAVAQQVGWSADGLKCYPRIRSILAQVVANYDLSRQKVFQKREQELVTQVQTTIDTLKAAHQRVTLAAISQTLNLHPATLKRYPQVKAILSQVTQQQSEFRRQQTQHREAIWLAKVQAAARILEASGQPVTQNMLARQAGTIPQALKCYPRLRIFLAQFNERQRQAKARQGQLWLEQVEQAITSLTAQGHALTKKRISDWVGVPLGRLQTHPPVKAALDEAIRRQSP